MKSQKDNIETSEHRSSVYGFLALIFRAEVTENMLEQLKNPALLTSLSDLGVHFEDDFSLMKGREDKLLEDLAVEYTRLFLGPGKHVSPHESVHHERDDGDWGQLWGADTVAVKKFIETSGLEYHSGYAGLPDHIGVELEFMGEVTRREAAAWKDNDREGALYCLKIEKKFIEEHLAQWVPAFCDKIIASAEMSFYREIAKLTKDFIETDKEEINNYIKNTEIDRRETCSD